MKKALTIIVLLSWITLLYPQENYDFAIYADTGTWKEGITAFEQFLKWKGLTYKLITAEEINNNDLDSFNVILFPGGDAAYYKTSIDTAGIQHIKNFLAQGGSYLGICAGAYFAASKIIWQDTAYNYPLNIFQGTAIGPINDIAAWPGYAMTGLTMNLSDSLNKFEPQTETMLYWGGPFFIPDQNTKIDTIATFTNFYNKPAIIKFTFNNARILLISTHPEIEEDSDRDSTDIANELSDNGSDWNFLWTATDWLLKKTISQPNTLITQSQNNQITIYPNPARNFIKIPLKPGQIITKITFYNLHGQKLLTINNPQSTKINITYLSPGFYITKIQMQNTIFTNKLIIY